MRNSQRVKKLVESTQSNDFIVYMPINLFGNNPSSTDYYKIVNRVKSIISEERYLEADKDSPNIITVSVEFT